MPLAPRVRTSIEWLATLVSVLLVLEICTRSFSSIPESVIERDDLIGVRFKRSLDLQRYDAESDRVVPLQTNTQRFRDEEWTRDKPPGVRRVAVFGDSFIAANALPCEQILVSRPESLLNRSKGPRHQVMNFGIGGSSTGQQLVAYRKLASEYDPDVVIVCFGNSSDVTDNSSELSSNPILRCRIEADGQLQTVVVTTAQRRGSQLLNRYSRFYDWQKHVVNRLVKQLRRGVRPLELRHRVYDTNLDPRFERAWDLTERILVQFRTEASNNGTRLVVVSIPASSQIHRDQFERLREQAGTGSRMEDDFPDTQLATICRRSRIPYLSLLPAFRAAAPDRDSRVLQQRLFLGGAGHFNKTGHELAADAIIKWLDRSQQPPSSEDRSKVSQVTNKP